MEETIRQFASVVMSWRTVIVSTQSKLDYQMGYLVVRNETTSRILIDEISILLIENPAVSLTVCLLSVLAEKKVRVVFCDEKHNPCSELAPYYGSFDCSSKIRTQIKWSTETKGIIWREIVREKIRQQANFLEVCKKTEASKLLLSYLEQVEVGDTTNREGHAAKVYFNALFGMDFSRSTPTPLNAALNYGYSIILSAVNREVAVNGYLTQIGIFHDNMFNQFNLGCDLMEPFRILVDRFVSKLPIEEFGRDEKHNMWNLLEDHVFIDDTSQTVKNAIKIYCKSVFDAINDNDTSHIKFFEVI